MSSRTRTLTLGAARADGLVPCTIATTAPVQRGGMREILDCSASGVDLSRAPLPLIVAHDQSRLAVGVVEALRAEGERVTGLARFGVSAEAQAVAADVRAGIHRSLSVGYRLTSEGRETEEGTVFTWLPLEVSIVSVPADSGAGFNRSYGVTMTTETSLREIATRHNALELCERMLAQGSTDAQIRAAIADDLARRDLATGGHMNVHGQAPRASGEASLIIETLVARMGGRPQGETLRSASVSDLACMALEMNGARVDRRDSRDRIFERAFATRSAGMHTTSDFPTLLGSAVNRVMMEAYTAAPAALRAVARARNSRDFRGRQAVRLPAAPNLERVNEHGEFQFGSVTELSNSWAPATFGRIIALSRQALVNDDLDGFADLIRQFAEAASRREADELAARVVTPGNVDGAALFSAGRNNLITGAGSALAMAGLSAAVAQMRAQRDAGQLVAQEPGALVVPAALETTARQLVANITPATTAAVQPFTNLQVVVEPRLDASSLTSWYLVARDQRALEMGYLEGNEGPQTFVEEGFDVDGTLVKCRLDFGCGWVSPVGWVRAAGA